MQFLNIFLIFVLIYVLIAFDEEAKETAKRIREAILKQCTAIENSI